MTSAFLPVNEVLLRFVYNILGIEAMGCNYGS